MLYVCYLFNPQKKNKKMEMRYRRLKERYSDPQTNKPKPAPAQNIHQEGYCSDEDKCRQPHKSRLRKSKIKYTFSDFVYVSNPNTIFIVPLTCSFNLKKAHRKFCQSNFCLSKCHLYVGYHPFYLFVFREF